MQEQPKPKNLLTAWRDLLHCLSESPLLCLCIDEAELLSDTGVESLKMIAETVGPVPIFLAVAGAPELWTRLTEQGSSPVTRIFSGASFDMEEFTVEETRAALMAPLRATQAKGSWAGEAVDQVQFLSHGYPYLVQCLAHAAYHEREITAKDVQDAVEPAVATAAPWLQHEISHASDAYVKAFVKLAESGQTAFRAKEIVQLGIPPLYIPALVKLGVLGLSARGHYDLKAAPVVAYYVALRRRLGFSGP